MLTGNRPAKLIYGLSGYRVAMPGEFVTCAVTGQQIPLEELRYWNGDLQEAYINADVSTKRMKEAMDDRASK